MLKFHSLKIVLIISIVPIGLSGCLGDNDDYKKRITDAATIENTQNLNNKAEIARLNQKLDQIRESQNASKICMSYLLKSHNCSLLSQGTSSPDSVYLDCMTKNNSATAPTGCVS